MNAHRPMSFPHSRPSRHGTVSPRTTPPPHTSLSPWDRFLIERAIGDLELCATMAGPGTTAHERAEICELISDTAAALRTVVIHIASRERGRT